MGLPKPSHSHGYPTRELAKILSASEMKKMWEFMYGQTCMLDDKTGDLIWYTSDVERGIRLIRYGTPTYWD